MRKYKSHIYFQIAGILMAVAAFIPIYLGKKQNEYYIFQIRQLETGFEHEETLLRNDFNQRLDNVIEEYTKNIQLHAEKEAESISQYCSDAVIQVRNSGKALDNLEQDVEKMQIQVEEIEKRVQNLDLRLKEYLNQMNRLQ